MQKNAPNMAPLVEIRPAQHHETPLGPTECATAIAAGTFEGCTLLSDLPAPAQQILRIVVGHGGSIGQATLRTQSWPLSSIDGPVQFLAAHGLLAIIKSGASYRVTKPGTQLVHADASRPRVAAPRTFFRAGSYEGKELQNNSTRPGAYTALQLASRGMLAS